jgi:hypothetical protein
MLDQDAEAREQIQHALDAGQSEKWHLGVSNVSPNGALPDVSYPNGHSRNGHHKPRA